MCLQDYKDDNHKPEMALALEDFEALCGFVSSAELKEQLRQQPELRLCVGEEAVSAILQAEGEQAKSVSAAGRAVCGRMRAVAEAKCWCNVGLLDSGQLL